MEIEVIQTITLVLDDTEFTNMKDVFRWIRDSEKFPPFSEKREWDLDIWLRCKNIATYFSKLLEAGH